MTETSTPGNTHPFVRDALVVGGVTALGYLVAHSYESEYAAYFAVPRELITLSPRLIIAASLALLAFAGTVLLISNGIFMMLPSILKKGYIGRRLAPVVPFVLLLVGYIANYGREWIRSGSAWVGVLLAVLVLFAFDWLAPLVRRKGDKRSYLERIQYTDEREKDNPDIAGLLVRRFGRWPIMTALYVFVAVAWAQGLGHRTASNKTEFLVDRDTGAVVIAIYGSTVVSTSYNDSTRTLGPDLTINVLGPGEMYRWRRASLQLKAPPALISRTRKREETTSRLGGPDSLNGDSQDPGTP